MDRTQPRTVGILIFNDVEVLDFAAPFEVFASARPIDISSALERLFRPLIVAAIAAKRGTAGGGYTMYDSVVRALVWALPMKA
jgi:hypothetical protein